MLKILLIEDDVSLCEKIKISLEKWDYHVSAVLDFKKIDSIFLEFKPHLVIMDIGLPYFDGYYWCKKIRAISHTPVLFLSSRDQNSDLIMGISIGGDDYITKPFSMEVLIAKIEALLRRAYDYDERENEVILQEGLLLDKDRSILSYENKDIDLTRNELRILSLLLKNKNQIVSRNKLMYALWDQDQFVNENTLTVNVNRLRGKLNDLGLKGLIKTQKGQGYSIDDQVLSKK